jgi:hypothetical protein
LALYRALLRAYPGPFRREWQRDMVQLFGDCCRDGYCAGGVGGLARVWGVALADLAHSVPRERLERFRRPGRNRRNRHIRLALRALAAERGHARAHTVLRGGLAAHQFHVRWLRRLFRRSGSRMPRGLPAQERGIMRGQFQGFTNRARQVFATAQEEAQRFNYNYIGTEHMLLGLLHDPESLAAKVMGDVGVDLEELRQAVEHIMGRGERMTLGDVGLTPLAKKSIKLAVAEARSMGHHYIGTEHLLLGMIRLGEGLAAGVLESRGVTPERTRAETLRRLREG